MRKRKAKPVAVPPPDESMVIWRWVSGAGKPYNEWTYCWLCSKRTATFFEVLRCERPGRKVVQGSPGARKYIRLCDSCSDMLLARLIEHAEKRRGGSDK